MEYRQGSDGRVFPLKFNDKDHLLEEIRNFAVQEQVRAAVITILGGMRSTGIVSGPRETVIPHEPQWISLGDGREVLGIGPIFWKEQAPEVHLHRAIGRGDETPARLHPERQLRLSRGRGAHRRDHRHQSPENSEQTDGHCHAGALGAP